MPINISGTAGVTPTQWTTAGRPANPNLGQSGWNTTIGGLEFYVGNDTWQTVASTAYAVDYLIVAGGGSGGANGTNTNVAGSGGGAGGVLQGSALSVSPGTSYTIVIGGGGAAVAR